MSTVHVVLLVTGAVTALLMLGAARRKLTAGQAPTPESADHPSISLKQYRLLGYVEVLAVIGIVLGIWFPALGLAAGIGVVALLVGALAFHLRLRHSGKAMGPALLGLAASAGFAAAQAVVIGG